MALTDNLVAYWKLDESSGDAADATGNGYTLTNRNTATFTTGKINNGASLSRASTQGFYNSSFGSGTRTAVSVSLWAKWSDSSDSYAVELTNTSSPYNQLSLKVNDNAGAESAGYISALIYDGSSASLVSKANTYNDGSWHHIVYVLDGATMYLYIDNVSKSGSSGSKAISNAQIALGYTKLNSVQFMDGMLDEVGVWSRALTSDEISSLYNGGSGLQYPFSTTSIKTINNLAKASVKTVNSLAISSVKTINGLS